MLLELSDLQMLGIALSLISGIVILVIFLKRLGSVEDACKEDDLRNFASDNGFDCLFRYSLEQLLTVTGEFQLFDWAWRRHVRVILIGSNRKEVIGVYAYRLPNTEGSGLVKQTFYYAELDVPNMSHRCFSCRNVLFRPLFSTEHVSNLKNKSVEALACKNGWDIELKGRGILLYQKGREYSVLQLQKILIDMRRISELVERECVPEMDVVDEDPIRN